MSNMTEDDVRRIVREELKLALESLAKVAHDADTYETGEIKVQALMAIEEVAKSAVYYLPHAADCRSRTDSYRYCDCGVEDSDY